MFFLVLVTTFESDLAWFHSQCHNFANKQMHWMKNTRVYIRNWLQAVRKSKDSCLTLKLMSVLSFLCWKHSSNSLIASFSDNSPRNIRTQLLCTIYQFEMFPPNAHTVVDKDMVKVKYNAPFLTLFEVLISTFEVPKGYMKLPLTWKNIWNLIGWEEYNIGRICTLFSIFELFY